MNKDVVFEHDVKVRMRDGVHLSYQRISAPKTRSLSGCHGRFAHMEGPVSTERNCSETCPVLTSARSIFRIIQPLKLPIRNYWVSHCMSSSRDVRGQGQSEGDTGPFHPQDRLDYYDLIEWAAVQPWSSGRIGLNGVSYLCISQWGVAALHPPHLSAVVLWEGWNGLYRRFYKGGIPETTFMWWLWDAWVEKATTTRHPVSPNRTILRMQWLTRSWTTTGNLRDRSRED